MEPKLLVIGGVMRGGTTLLHDILSTHPAIALFSRELRALKWCGLSVPAHLARVQHHLFLAKRWLRHPGFPREVYRYLWHLVRVSGPFRGAVTVDLCHRAFAAALERPGSLYVGDKYPDYVFGCRHFLQESDCRVILIVRDPRDVVASILVRIREGDWAGKRWARPYATVAGACRYWNEAAGIMATVNRANRFEQANEEPAGALVIRYEDLVTATQSVVDGIARYLGVDAGGFAANSAHARSLGKYVHRLEASETREIEQKTAPLMAAFGYT